MNAPKIAIAILNRRITSRISEIVRHVIFKVPLQTMIRSLFLPAFFCIALPLECFGQSDPSTLENSPQYTEDQIKSGLKNLSEIMLNGGVNNVRFDGTDEQAQIDIAMRCECYDPVRGIHSHWVYFISTKDPIAGWDVTPIGVDESSIIEDEWYDGWDFRSVRFANGSLNGKKETFLFVTTLDGDPHVKPWPTATISVDTLQEDQMEQLEFRPILQIETKASYDDADEALLDELNIPLPAHYNPDPGQ